MLRRVALVRTDVSEEHRFLQEPHDVKFQNMAFFRVIAVKTSNPTYSDLRSKCPPSAINSMKTPRKNGIVRKSGNQTSRPLHLLVYNRLTCVWYPFGLFSQPRYRLSRYLLESPDIKQQLHLAGVCLQSFADKHSSLYDFSGLFFPSTKIPLYCSRDIHESRRVTCNNTHH
jgi:hypothetical protein